MNDSMCQERGFSAEQHNTFLPHCKLDQVKILVKLNAGCLPSFDFTKYRKGNDDDLS